MRTGKSAPTALVPLPPTPAQPRADSVPSSGSPPAAVPPPEFEKTLPVMSCTELVSTQTFMYSGSVKASSHQSDLGSFLADSGSVDWQPAINKPQSNAMNFFIGERLTNSHKGCRTSQYISSPFHLLDRHNYRHSSPAVHLVAQSLLGPEQP